MPDYVIHYVGGAATVSALAQMLREEGVDVAYDPPSEHRGAAEVAEAVVVSIAASGAYDAIRAAIRRFRERFPRSSVEVEGDDQIEHEP